MPSDAVAKPHDLSRPGSLRRWWSVAFAALCVTTSAVGWAQPGPGVPRPPGPRLGPPSRFATPPDEPAEPDREYVAEISEQSPGWLRRSFGLGRAMSLLDHPDRATRARGVERLGSLGTREAIGQLTDLLEPDADGQDGALLRLAAIRALAAHAEQEDARDALSAVMGGSDPGSTLAPLDRLSQQTAAMALARSGSDRAVTALVAAVIQGGDAGQSAGRALQAVFPQSLEAVVGKRALVGKPKRIPPQVVALLGAVGDLRAITVLRGQLTLKPRAVQLAAAVALARLGDGSVEPKLRSWLARDAKVKLAPAERVAAVEGLLRLDAPGAKAALGALLGSKETRKAALELALASPGPELVAALATVVGGAVTRSERERAVDVLGRIGSDEACAILLRMLARPELATMAAFELASSPSGTARRGLQQALASASSGAARRLVVRAALVRHAKLGERIEGLDAALDATGRSADPADRWVAAQGRALLAPEQTAELLHDADQATALGAATVSGASAAVGLGACAERLGEISRELELAGPRAPWATGAPDEAAPLDAIACGAALLADSTPVASSVLARWAEAGGGLAPLSARALGARDPQAFRSRLEQLIGGTDPTIRAHVALGLGHSPQPDATSRLVRAYREEAEPGVRRAIVRGLSQRRDPLRRAALELAARLDPDDEARALARSALRGLRHTEDPVVAGPEVLWVSLLGSQAPTSGATAFRQARVVRADGIALPVVSAPDGNILVLGLPRTGRVAVHVATATTSGDAPR